MRNCLTYIYLWYLYPSSYLKMQSLLLSFARSTVIFRYIRYHDLKRQFIIKKNP